MPNDVGVHCDKQSYVQDNMGAHSMQETDHENDEHDDMDQDHETERLAHRCPRFALVPGVPLVADLGLVRDVDGQRGEGDTFI